MSEEEHVLFEIDDGVGVVTLNRPDRMNAVHWDMAEQLVNLFRDMRQNDDVRTIVLTGAGDRAFCAGGDVTWLSGGTDRPIPGLSDLPVPRYQRKTPGGPFSEFTKAIIDVEKPVIAAIPGVADVRQLEENVQASYTRDVALTRQELQELARLNEGLFDRLPEKYQWLRNWEHV